MFVDKHNYRLASAYGEGPWRIYEFKCKMHNCKKTYRIFRSLFWSTRSK